MSEKYLANENFPAETVRFLREKGDDIVYAAEIMIGASDEVILQTAMEQDRVVLTFDRDFGELVFHRRRPSASGVVLFRLGQVSPDQMLSFLRIFFEAQPKLRGFFTVASPGHFRQVRLATA